MQNAVDDLENRRPVWDAVSELYLDTESQPDDYERIANVLRSSPYLASELDHIMYTELYPVLIANCWDVAGEWSAFDLDWLQDAILERAAQRFTVPPALFPGRSIVRGPWNTVRRMATEFPT